jgi:hypothetical protein
LAELRGIDLAAGAVMLGVDVSGRSLLIVSFGRLPRLPVRIIFNERDEGFPAQCSLLFQRSAEAMVSLKSMAATAPGLPEAWLDPLLAEGTWRAGP